MTRISYKHANQDFLKIMFQKLPHSSSRRNNQVSVTSYAEVIKSNFYFHAHNLQIDFRGINVPNWQPSFIFTKHVVFTCHLVQANELWF